MPETQHCPFITQGRAVAQQSNVCGSSVQLNAVNAAAKFEKVMQSLDGTPPPCRSANACVAVWQPSYLHLRLKTLQKVGHVSVPLLRQLIHVLEEDVV